MKKLLGILVILAVVVGADYIYSLYHVPPELDFHDLSLTDMSGQPVALKDMQGKKLLLNFFETSDDSCTQRLPLIEKAQAALGKDNFVFLCISDEPLNKLASFRQKTGTNLVFLRSNTKLSDLKILTLPTTYILNPKGELIYKKTGEKDWDNEETLHELKSAQ